MILRSISTENTINARCATVANSKEAAANDKAKAVAEKIKAGLLSYNTIRLSIENTKILVKENSQLQKITLTEVADGIINGNRMLESIKPVESYAKENIKNKTDLYKLTPVELLKMGLATSTSIQDKKEELLAYGYNESQLSPLSSKCTTLSSLLQKEITLQTQLAQQRSEKEQLDKEIEANYYQLNNIISINKLLMPKLYRDFYAIKMPTSKRVDDSIAVRVTSGGNALANAQVTILEVEVPAAAKSHVASNSSKAAAAIEKTIIEKMTNPKGEANIKRVKPGAYRLQVGKHGFIMQEITVYVNPNETTEVFIELESI